MVSKSIKRYGTTIAVGLFLTAVPAAADHLKESLSSMLKKKDEMPGMVNLDAIGSADAVVPKSRPSNAVVATVNGTKVLKKEADDYLSNRTKGKVTDFDLLPKEQRLALIKEISLPMLLADSASKELSKEEKKAVLSRAWMAKQAHDANISDAEIQRAYERIKTQTQARSALSQVPPLKAMEERIRMQIVEQKVLQDLMRGAEIRIAENVEGIAGYAGMMAIGIDEVNRALQVMTKGKMRWESVPPQDRMRVLQMVAPSKFIALAAENSLTQEERNNALSNYWMQKRLSQISVTDKEAKKRYEKISKMQKKAKSKKKLPDFATLEKSLKMQIANEKLIESLTDQAVIKLK